MRWRFASRDACGIPSYNAREDLFLASFMVFLASPSRKEQWIGHSSGRWGPCPVVTPVCFYGCDGSVNLPSHECLHVRSITYGVLVVRNHTSAALSRSRKRPPSPLHFLVRTDLFSCVDEMGKLGLPNVVSPPPFRPVVDAKNKKKIVSDAASPMVPLAQIAYEQMAFRLLLLVLGYSRLY